MIAIFLSLASGQETYITVFTLSLCFSYCLKQVVSLRIKNETLSSVKHLKTGHEC